VTMRFAVVFVLSAMMNLGCSRDSAPTNLPPNPQLSPNAPQDQPVEVTDQAKAEEYRVAIAPYVEKGRKTYPAGWHGFYPCLMAILV
jgi:hypothetical protein